jgi:hypothetical protein
MAALRLTKRLCLVFEYKGASDFVMQPLLLLCESDHYETDAQNKRRKNL